MTYFVLILTEKLNKSIMAADVIFSPVLNLYRILPISSPYNYDAKSMTRTICCYYTQ